MLHTLNSRHVLLFYGINDNNWRKCLMMIIMYLTRMTLIQKIVYETFKHKIKSVETDINPF